MADQPTDSEMLDRDAARWRWMFRSSPDGGTYTVNFYHAWDSWSGEGDFGAHVDAIMSASSQPEPDTQ